MQINVLIQYVHFQEDALRETSNQKYDEAVSSVEMAQMKNKLENTIKDMKEKEEELSEAKRELSETNRELSNLQTEVSQIKSDLTRLENEKKDLENKLQVEKKESGYWESKASDLETDLQVFYK